MPKDTDPDFVARVRTQGDSGPGKWIDLGPGFVHDNGLGINVLLNQAPPLDPETKSFKVSLFLTDKGKARGALSHPASRALQEHRNARAERPAPVDLTATPQSCTACQDTGMIRHTGLPCRKCQPARGA